jgi:PRA1 family protein 1
MPLWGRPFGAREGQRQELQERNMLQWEEDMRFEVVDGNDDEGYGVGIEAAFINDGLDSAEGFLTAQQQARPKLYESHPSCYSEREYEPKKNSSGGIRQLAYKDKEEYLVKTALDRIRRAQALGKNNVRLTKPELDALERKQRKNQITGRNPAFPDRPAHRPSDTTQGSLAFMEPKPSKRRIFSTNFDRGYTGPVVYGRTASQATPPSLGPENQSNVMSGYYSGPRAELYDLTMPPGAGSHDQQRQSASPSSSQPRDPQKRYFSVPEMFGSSSPLESPAISRPLPDDPRWIPRPRSASSTQPYVIRDVQHPANANSLRHVTLTHPQGRRRIPGWTEPYPTNPGGGIQPLLVIKTTQPRPSLLEPRSDDSVSLTADIKHTVDDMYDNDRPVLDYGPYHEPDASPASFYEQYSRG